MTNTEAKEIRSAIEELKAEGYTADEMRAALNAHALDFDAISHGEFEIAMSYIEEAR